MGSRLDTRSEGDLRCCNLKRDCAYDGTSYRGCLFSYTGNLRVLLQTCRAFALIRALWYHLGDHGTLPAGLKSCLYSCWPSGGGEFIKLGQFQHRSRSSVSSTTMNCEKVYQKTHGTNEFWGYESMFLELARHFVANSFADLRSDTTRWWKHLSQWKLTKSLLVANVLPSPQEGCNADGGALWEKTRPKTSTSTDISRSRHVCLTTCQRSTTVCDMLSLPWTLQLMRSGKGEHITYSRRSLTSCKTHICYGWCLLTCWSYHGFCLQASAGDSHHQSITESQCVHLICCSSNHNILKRFLFSYLFHMSV